jgi:hypothetical protein
MVSVVGMKRKTQRIMFSEEGGILSLRFLMSGSAVTVPACLQATA